MNINLLLKGFIIGIAKIIPGVSGAVLAISLGIYDKSINAITNFFSNIKENIKLLLNLGIGILLAILIFSKIINYTLTNYFFLTMIFFLGLIIGGIIPIIKEIKINKTNYLLILLSFLLIFFLSITNINNNYILHNNYLDIIYLIFGGFLEGIGTIIPGISGTALLMISGLYNIIIDMIGHLSINNLRIIIPFSIGIVLSILTITNLIKYLLDKYKEKTYSLILGFSLGSILLLIIKTFSIKIKILDLILGLILFILGLYISKKLD